MLNYSKTIGALAAAACISTAFAGSEAQCQAIVKQQDTASAINYNVTTGYTNEYLWRGLDLGKDLVEVGLSASTTYNCFEFTAGLWHANFEQNDDTIRELDLFASVAKDLGFAKATAGYIYYNYPNNDDHDDAQEAYLSLSRSIYGLDAAVTHYFEIEGDNDGYTEGSLGKSIPLSPSLTLRGSGHLGYLVEQGQASHIGSTVALDYKVSQNATLSPYVAAAWSLNNDQDTAYGKVDRLNGLNGTGNEFVAGVKLSVNF